LAIFYEWGNINCIPENCSLEEIMHDLDILGRRVNNSLIRGTKNAFINKSAGDREQFNKST